jgi:hypothetical protein
VLCADHELCRHTDGVTHHCREAANGEQSQKQVLQKAQAKLKAKLIETLPENNEKNLMLGLRKFVTYAVAEGTVLGFEPWILPC